jgi:hypothetical protein
MVLGNLASIALAIAGILQALSWTIVGAMILAILSITTLAPTRPPNGTGRSAGKKTGHTGIETKQLHEKGQPKQTPTRPEQRQVVRDESLRSPSQTRSEFQKVMAPKITPPKSVPTIVGPGKPNPAKPGAPKPEVIRPIPVGPGLTTSGIARAQTPRLDPNTRIIAKGDLATYDVELGARAEVTCEISATAPVNVYLMDEDNLNSLELGEEFWSESGEETVQNATLHFVAPQAGKWVLVVENVDNKEVSAKVNIRKGPPSRAAPST